MLTIEVETYPLDFVPDGDRFVVKEGQLVMHGPITLDGELVVEGHLIITGSAS